ncbi:apolipoprotein N-acyltransferase [Altericroceibacterium endophyticum]|uniref:Apolipoprotein N-acyltransferase n=1 Tax=Altericroceibacterium endophyticum TaxID=1808508 RepID=A0A6I4T3G2_9SPHN|nr:apolipoprotein N-acyltransferase [Altericroceibacterium endophyticum]MXO65447.1 apolipoprotein N-acyltransferase [Altericroceibacterium endophyticum]
MKAFGQFSAWFAMRPRLSAFALGILSAAAFRPLTIWPLAFLSIAGLIALVFQSSTVKRATGLGWLFGFGHFTAGNIWIAQAFTYQAEMPAALGWAAVPLLALYLALYPALAAGTARWLMGDRRGWSAIAAFAACWIVSEWLRSWVFTGFPWNPLGAVLIGPFDRPGLAVLAPWLGTYALSGLVVLLAGTGLWLARDRRIVPFAVLCVLVIAGMYVPSWQVARDSTVHFTLVQPDIRQEKLNDPASFEENFIKTARLSLPDSPGQERLVLWPESGVPDYLRDGYPQRYYNHMTALGDPEFARHRLARVVGENSLLLTGTTDLDISDGRAVGARNVVTAIDDTGNIRAGYAKAHLVPFGEYLALRWLLEPLGGARLVAGTIDFLPGPGPRTLDLGNYGQAGVQICYEIIFSGRITDPENRPDYIFNPSNDGWFGTIGPPQHLAQARLRAIEEGLPVLRATTTGISAVIDARGIVRQYRPLHVAGRIDGTVPAAAEPTLFSFLGNVLPLAWAIVLLLPTAVAIRRIGL